MTKKISSTNKWNVPVECLNKISLEDAKFIFDHAEKQLQDTVNSSDIIVARTTTLITVSVAFLTALIGYSISRLDNYKSHDKIFITAAISAMCVFLICLYLKKNIQPKNYAIIGAEPILFFRDNFFNDSIEEKQRLIYLYINEIENYQDRIKMNKETNENRWAVFKKSIMLLILMPFAIPIIYWIVIHLSL
jgi:hypothetical protein